MSKCIKKKICSVLNSTTYKGEGAKNITLYSSHSTGNVMSLIFAYWYLIEFHDIAPGC